MHPDLLVLNGLWVGDRLPYLEQLCLVSGLAAGHQVRLFTYNLRQLRGVPSGVQVYDAAEVMPKDRMVQHAGSFALGADFWRYEMLARGLGCWIDLDVLILKPLRFEANYVFGEELEGGLNSAVLFAPPGSGLVQDLCATPRPNNCPPWFGPRNRLKFYMRKWLRGPVKLEDFPWGTFGPRMLTYLVKKHDLMRYAAPPEVFYPISWRNIRAIYDRGRGPAQAISEKTLAIHLYNSQLRTLAHEPPPAGSYLAEVCNELGILSKVTHRPAAKSQKSPQARDGRQRTSSPTPEQMPQCVSLEAVAAQ